MDTSVNKLNRRSSIESDHSKKKSSRACTPCRKRKVKCNGQQPCDRCSKTEAICIYDKPQQKKDTPKPISDNHEPRLKVLEQFLKQFSNLLDITDPEPPLFSTPNQVGGLKPHRLSINTTGQGLYVPDKYLRTDRIPDLYKPGMSDWNPVIQEVLATTVDPPSLIIEPIRENLIHIFFQFVDPVIPILHKPSFFHQLRHGQPISQLLLNAIYCVSSRWDVGFPLVGEEPRGWAFYQQAVRLLDQQSEVKLSTVQGLFLLLKYNEHVRRPGFISRTRYYFQMIVRMCKDLGLPREIVCTSNNMFIEIEKRKRTFWAVYCYDVMMSIENGTLPNFSSEDYSVDIPHVMADEAQEPEKIMHFILLTKIMRNQSDILNFLYRKHNKPTNTRRGKSFDELTNELKATIGFITSTTKFPGKENMCYTICFLYLASCFATILLHRPFALFQQESISPITRSHRGHCTEAASRIKLITELILECNAFEDMYCSIRGIQQIVHYLSAAITVFKEGRFELELSSTLRLTHTLASISPATEVVGRRHQPQKQQQQQQQQQQKMLEKSIKRKSLHLPDEQQQQQYNINQIIPMQYELQQPQPQPQPQPQHMMMDTTTHYDNQLYTTVSSPLPNIPNHQSLLGLLFNNEDDTIIRNNIPT
ncbi:fungal-specific transcription factor domain-containing protein [Pilaira anomala]|nr:fungal-specific transcription factor domain-containing protein [Pilaira anomala]